MKKELTLQEISKKNYDRCRRWHDSPDLDDWSVSDWSVALAGEVGEICNAVKKLKRLESNYKGINDPGREIKSLDEAKRKIGEEIGDSFLYLDLLARRLGLNFEQEIINKFNSTSEKYGFPEKL